MHSTASQFVIEEKIMTSFGAIKPLRAVGLEGLFGVISTTLTMIILHVVAGRQHPGTVFDIADGWRQLTGNQSIMLYSCAIAVSIGLFNAGAPPRLERLNRSSSVTAAGLSVTRQISATARSTIDTCRTVGIWAVCVCILLLSLKLLDSAQLARPRLGVFPLIASRRLLSARLRHLVRPRFELD